MQGYSVFLMSGPVLYCDTGCVLDCKTLAIVQGSMALLLYIIINGYHCMAANVSVQHNGGFLPGVMLLTQCYYHRGTRFNAMKRFCICSL